MSGEVTITMDAADHVSASKAIFRWQVLQPRFWKRLAIVLLIVTGIAAICLRLLDGDWGASAMVAPLSGAGGLLAVLLGSSINYLLLPRRVRRLVAQQRGYRDEIRVRWDDGRYQMSSESWSSGLAWKDYYRWVESEFEFLFFLNEQIPHFLPKRVLSADQIVDLRATLVEYGPARG